MTGLFLIFYAVAASMLLLGALQAMHVRQMAERDEEAKLVAEIRDLTYLRVIDEHRLAVVRALHPEQTVGLDELARDAALGLGADLGGIYIVDDKYTTACAYFGVAGGPSNTPVRQSYCQFVVAQDAIVAVEDARESALFCSLDATISAGVAAYLGIPLHLSGQAVGSMCVVCFQPRRWSAQDEADLKTYARQAERTLASAL